MSQFVTKYSGNQDNYDTGDVRDISDNKSRFDLIPLEILDLLQQSYGGMALDIDNSIPYYTGFIDTEEIRVDLIPELILNRLGGLYYRGALKYGINNYQKGMPLSRYYQSLLRHLIQWVAGDSSEDHLSSVIWNVASIMWTEHAIKSGQLNSDLADVGVLFNEPKWYGVLFYYEDTTRYYKYHLATWRNIDDVTDKYKDDRVLIVGPYLSEQEAQKSVDGQIVRFGMVNDYAR
jgi:hypothetical protein